MSLDIVLLFVPAALLVGLTPGANNLLAFASAARVGWRHAALALGGRMAAFAVLTGLVAFGLDALLRTSLFAFLALKWLGVAYLLYLAVRFWTARTDGEAEVPPPGTLMRREFLTLMGNPKAYLLMTAFLPQFVSPAAPAMPQLMTLGGLYILAETAAALTWIMAGAMLGRHALTPLRRRLMNRVSAGLMTLAAGALARTDRAV